MRIRRITAAAAIGLALAGFAAAQPALADMGAATPRAEVSDVSAAQAYDFKFEGVRIFHDPTASASVNGLGYPGQGLTILEHREDGEYYLCDDGNYSLNWWLISNSATGVTGWIPGCNLRY